MKNLIGKTITKVLTNPEKTLMGFELSDGATMYYMAYGDCCSESWFNHFSGLQLLLNATVQDYEQVNMKDVVPSGRQEVDLAYSQKLKTIHGIIDIELRNSSNGYYGGDIVDVTQEYTGKPRYIGTLEELTNDF